MNLPQKHHRNQTEADKHYTRERVLDAAAALFAQRGFDGVSVREIVAEADTHLSAVNYHFGGKWELYLDVFRILWRRWAETVRLPLLELESRPDPRPELVVRTLVECLLKSPLPADKHRMFGMLIAREASQPTEAFEVLLETHWRPTAELLERLMARALGRPVDRFRMGLYLMSVVSQGITFNRSRLLIGRLSDRELDASLDEALIDHVTEFAMRGLPMVIDD
jgi:AcrR family transcriptional regulator